MTTDRAVSATGAVAREERCVVLYARVADGVSAEQGYAIRDALDGAETNGWWFLNPGTFVVVFLAKTSGARLASSCEAILNHLAAEHPSWAEISIGSAEGKLFGAFTSDGILESLPVGGVVTAAMQKAMKKSTPTDGDSTRRGK